ncbi:hypothetical protein ASE63_11385 [Bosea sp. Root381]|uniref:hypothetical protein n=1 Tax=Bosea sp. Root381 TaxID=1736524 RepID=UPI0006FA3562|nr:hypothetical protein [Bosea sp. Root381]KRD96294.1 hypothetical protein ASE63_11385 [Bosea sp. Root381]
MQSAISDFATITALRPSVSASEPFQSAADKIAAFPAVAPHALAAQPAPHAPAASAAGVPAPLPAAPQRDWPSALALIEETSEAMRISDQRYAQLEERLHQTAGQAAASIRELEAQIAATNDQLWRAEERARQAELRALEAEAWLARLHDAVTSSFARANRAPSRG